MCEQRCQFCQSGLRVRNAELHAEARTAKVLKRNVRRVRAVALSLQLLANNFVIKGQHAAIRVVPVYRVEIASTKRSSLI